MFHDHNLEHRNSFEFLHHQHNGQQFHEGTTSNSGQLGRRVAVTGQSIDDAASLTLFSSNQQKRHQKHNFRLNCFGIASTLRATTRLQQVLSDHNSVKQVRMGDVDTGRGSNIKMNLEWALQVPKE